MSEPRYTLHHADCLEVLAGLEAQSVDCTIADVPYGTTACAWDTPINLAAMWRELKRISKPRAPIVLFAGQPFTAALIMSNVRMFKYTWVWNKNNSAGFATVKYRPFIITEDICVFGGKKITYFPQMETRGKVRPKGWAGAPSDCYGLQPIARPKNNAYYPKNIINISKRNKYEALHPTQKPLELLEYLVLTYSNPHDVVLDFTMGSGTTGEACANKGRRFIGVELYPLPGQPIDKKLNPGYFPIAEQRVSAAYARALEVTQ